MSVAYPEDPKLWPAMDRYVEASWRVNVASDDVERAAAQADVDAAQAELRAGGYYRQFETASEPRASDS